MSSILISAISIFLSFSISLSTHSQASGTIHFSWTVEVESRGMLSSQKYVRIILYDDSISFDKRWLCSYNRCTGITDALSNQRSRMWKAIDEGAQIVFDLNRFSGADTEDIFWIKSCQGGTSEEFFSKNTKTATFDKTLPYLNPTAGKTDFNLRVCRFTTHDGLIAQVYYDSNGVLMYQHIGKDPTPMQDLKNNGRKRSYSFSESQDGEERINQFVPGTFSFSGCPTVHDKGYVFSKGPLCDQLKKSGPHWNHLDRIFGD